MVLGVTPGVTPRGPRRDPWGKPHTKHFSLSSEFGGVLKDTLRRSLTSPCLFYFPPAVSDGRRIHWENPWADLSLVRWHRELHVSPSGLCGGCSFLQTSAFPSTGRSAPRTDAQHAVRKTNTSHLWTQGHAPLTLPSPAEAAPPEPRRSWWPPAAGRAISAGSRPQSRRWRRWRCRSRKSWRGRGFCLHAPGAGSRMCCITRRDTSALFVLWL